MRYIDSESVRSVLPQRFEDDAQEAHDGVAAIAGNERSAAIDKKSNIWRDLKDDLADLRSRKCWYCESIQDRSDNAVDHYRPKNRVAESPEHGGYWWLAFCWKNYRYTCTFCNSRRVDQDGGTAGGKHDHFPLWDEAKRCQSKDGNLDDEQPMLLDPCQEDDPDHLWFNEDGSPAANPTICGEPGTCASERVVQSISLYHLDHVDLTERRAALCKQIKEDATDGDNMLVKARNGDMTARQSFRMMVRRLGKSIKEDQELSATALCMLEGLRESSPTAYAALRH
jgi:5-methylcytosine-specific restriction endonuclease McrA